MFKVNNRNTRTCGMCSKLTIKTRERRHHIETSPFAQQIKGLVAI